MILSLSKIRAIHQRAWAGDTPTHRHARNLITTLLFGSAASTAHAAESVEEASRHFQPLKDIFRPEEEE